MFMEATKGKKKTKPESNDSVSVELPCISYSMVRCIADMETEKEEFIVKGASLEECWGCFKSLKGFVRERK